MRATVQASPIRSAEIGPGVTPVAHRAATVEVARARLSAATRHGDPIDVEAACRAYGAAVSLARLADLARLIGALPLRIRQRIQGPRATAASVPQINP
jgi:hypothetical protein